MDSTKLTDMIKTACDDNWLSYKEITVSPHEDNTITITIDADRAPHWNLNGVIYRCEADIVNNKITHADIEWITDDSLYNISGATSEVMDTFIQTMSQLQMMIDGKTWEDLDEED